MAYRNILDREMAAKEERYKILHVRMMTFVESDKTSGMYETNIINVLTEMIAVKQQIEDIRKVQYWMECGILK